jgi:hypothetical protein
MYEKNAEPGKRINKGLLHNKATALSSVIDPFYLYAVFLQKP